LVAAAQQGTKAAPDRNNNGTWLRFIPQVAAELRWLLAMYN
jgi:hypothetical protein